MPDGDRNRVSIAVASIPAFLAMKGYAIANRLKRKDAYDIYYSVKNFPDGIDALVQATRPLLDIESALQGYSSISDKFRNVEDFGPTSVKRFVEGLRGIAVDGGADGLTLAVTADAMAVRTASVDDGLNPRLFAFLGARDLGGGVVDGFMFPMN